MAAIEELNFVKRFRSPKSYPFIKNADGTVSTHRMTSAETDGRFIAYPTIVQTKSGVLVELNRTDAFKYAMKNKEFKEFKTEKESQVYAEGGYKKEFGADDNSTIENFNYLREVY